MGLFRKTVGLYSQKLYEVARNLLKSRDTQRKKAESWQQTVRQQAQIIQRLQEEMRRGAEQLREARQQLEQAQQEVLWWKQRPLVLPDDPPLPQHTYGARMISLCIQLAKKVGLRASVEVLKIMWDWLAIKTAIPCWTSVRMWLCRMGVDELEHVPQKQEDWIWMADHSNQIGKEKLLTILGVRASDLPPAGQTLRHQDVRVLAVVPGTSWKREDVAAQYLKLADKMGIPKMLLTDGAVELRESAEVLEKDGKKPILLRDLKHFAANVLERMIGKSESFNKYLSLLGSTRSAIQQTELSHFTPPSPKPKARFMNLGAILRWGEMVLWQLENPNSQARQGIEVSRMEAKLGWLRDYRHELAVWRRLDSVIDNSLAFLNTHGLYRGAAAALRLRLRPLLQTGRVACPASRQLSETLIAFVLSSETPLAVGERGWLSTEIVESAFGLYKTLEGQHSKSGYTSLIASFGCLLCPCSPPAVRARFGRTSVKQVTHWVRTHLGQTHSSKKLSAYRKTLPPITRLAKT